MPTERLAPMDDAQRRWARFKAAVILNGLTLGEAARYLGVSYSLLVLVIKGERQGSIELQEKIAEVLGEEPPTVSFVRWRR